MNLTQFKQQLLVKDRILVSLFFIISVTAHDASLHVFIKAHAAVPATVFFRLSEPAEQHEVSHQAQLDRWQDLLE